MRVARAVNIGVLQRRADAAEVSYLQSTGRIISVKWSLGNHGRRG